MTPARAVTFVVPEGVDDEESVSGGNIFDLRLRDGLISLGWDVRFAPVMTVPTPTPRIAGAPRGASGHEAPSAASVLAEVEDGGLVLIDGLVAGRSAPAVEAESDRLRIVLLAHMVSAAFADADADAVDGERRALAAAQAVVTTSGWTAGELVRSGLADESAVVVARPGADDAPAADGSPTGRVLLCVGVVAPHKGQDVLIEALAALADAGDWSCTIAGSLDAEPAFAERIRALAESGGIADRVRIPGVLSRPALDEAYGGTDLVVVPSRVESYGMVVADALRRGIPVVASDVGGIPEAVASSRGAMLVPAGDRRALQETLGRWMADPELRRRLTACARSDRERLPAWRDTAVRVAAALEEVAR